MASSMEWVTKQEIIALLKNLPDGKVACLIVTGDACNVKAQHATLIFDSPLKPI